MKVLVYVLWAVVLLATATQGLVTEPLSEAFEHAEGQGPHHVDVKASPKATGRVITPNELGNVRREEAQLEAREAKASPSPVSVVHESAAEEAAAKAGEIEAFQVAPEDKSSELLNVVPDKPKLQKIAAQEEMKKLLSHPADAAEDDTLENHQMMQDLDHDAFAKHGTPDVEDYTLLESAARTYPSVTHADADDADAFIAYSSDDEDSLLQRESLLDGQARIADQAVEEVQARLHELNRHDEANRVIAATPAVPTSAPTVEQQLPQKNFYEQLGDFFDQTA